MGYGGVGGVTTTVIGIELPGYEGPVNISGPPGPPGPMGPSGAPKTIQDEGVALTLRDKLNFTGAGVIATDDAANGCTVVNIPGGGQAATIKFRIGHTWGLVGDVTAITTLPSAFVFVVSPQTVTMVGLRAKIASGTSVGVQVKRNGASVGSVITVTAAAATTIFSQALADGDELTMTLSSPVGAPAFLSATLVLEHSI